MKYEQNHLTPQFQDNKWLCDSKIGYVSEHIIHTYDSISTYNVKWTASLILYASPC